jgi:hypothetical protein
MRTKNETLRRGRRSRDGADARQAFSSVASLETLPLPIAGRRLLPPPVDRQGDRGGRLWGNRGHRRQAWLGIASSAPSPVIRHTVLNQAASGSCPGCSRYQTQLCSLGLCGRGSDVIVDSRFDGGEKEFFSELREEAEPPKFVFYRVFEFSKTQLDAAVA